MTRLTLASALVTVALGSPAFAQTGPGPISRADYMKNVENQFRVVDTNHDGGISRAELAAEQQKELAQAKAAVAQQIQARFKQLDTNKDGQLSPAEFSAMVPAIRTTDGPDQVLQRLDANKDGKVSPDEYRLPQVATFNKVDANRDGIVTPDEMKAAAGNK